MPPCQRRCRAAKPATCKNQSAPSRAATRCAVLVRAGGALTTRSGAGDQGFVREFARAVRGKDANYDYALAQEFGTQHIPAQPFFWPTYRARKRRIRRAIKDSAKAAINKHGAADMSVADASLELQKAIVAALKAQQRRDGAGGHAHL